MTLENALACDDGWKYAASFGKTAARFMKFPEHQKAWYAMRVSYCREMFTKNRLEELSIRNFVPMSWKTVVSQGRRQKRLDPAIHNLIFIYESKQTIDQLKSATLPSLRYIMQTDAKEQFPIIVGDEEMTRFIAVSDTYNTNLLYMQPGELVRLDRGDRVRIVDGPFKNTEGVCQTVNGSKYRRVIVEIEGLIGLAVVGIHPILL